MQPNPFLLQSLAAKYIWWKPAIEAIRTPLRVVAQVMNIGTFQDMQGLAEHVGDDYLREVLQNAEPGQFNERSWSYWHYRLCITPSEEVPPMPQRRFG